MKTAIKLILIYLGIQLVCGGLIGIPFTVEYGCHPDFRVDTGSFDVTFHGSDVFLFMESPVHT